MFGLHDWKIVWYNTLSMRDGADYCTRRFYKCSRCGKARSDEYHDCLSGLWTLKDGEMVPATFKTWKEEEPFVIPEVLSEE
jgi:hypothetical protein